MKKFLSVILVIIITITILIMIGLFGIGNLSKKSFTDRLLKNIDVSAAIKNNNDDYLNVVYRRLKIYGVNEENVNKVIDSKLFNEYSLDISSKYLDCLLNNKINYEDIDDTTLEFIKDANIKYNLKLSNDDVEDISNIVSNNIYKSSLNIKSNDNINKIIKVINFCKQTYIRLCIIILLIIEIISLYYLTKNRHTFINNICIVFLLSGLLLSGSSSIIQNIFKIKFGSLLYLVNPIFKTFYNLSIIFFILIVVLLILKLIFKKKPTN